MRLIRFAERLLREYVEQGGGLIVEPIYSGGGDSVSERYNRFLRAFDARQVALQVYHKAETKDGYAPAALNETHPVTKGVTHLLYPTNVLRWDNAYSAVPVIAGPEWTVLAEGKAGSGAYLAQSNTTVRDDPETKENALLAIRPYRKGRLVLSGISAYYTLTHTYFDSPETNGWLGENHVGRIAGILLYGEKGGRPSEGAKLLDRLYRFLGDNSAEHGIGNGDVPLPEQLPAPDTDAVIDWTKAKPAPTWRHRPIPVEKNGTTYYDEQVDRAVVGEIRHFKVLVGPRTGLSSGEGTVLEYRRAAEKAGYNAIAFCETLEDMNPQKWDFLVRLCRDASDDSFVCVPGLDAPDAQGGRYLIIRPNRFPKKAWLTPDGRRLAEIRWMSLGFWGHLAVVHRPGHGALDPRMYKQYHGISVYTYDAEGKLADDGWHTYQWGVHSDSNPIPVVVHEIVSPDQVAKAATAGFQQILPADDIVRGMDYFCYGFPHYFSCPVRYYISEGPVLDGWGIFNKDVGKPEENRDHFRMTIGLSSDVSLREVTLYDEFDVVRRWRPAGERFDATVDDFHRKQRQFLLRASDSKGREVISPGIRTVTRNYRARCGDRQNWLGSTLIYTGTPPETYGTYQVAIRHTKEGGTHWPQYVGGNPAAIYDFPFFSNHVQIMELEHRNKYYKAKHLFDVAYDAKPVFAVRPNVYTEGTVRYTTFAPPKEKDFAVLRIDTEIRCKRPIEPDLSQPVYPMLLQALPKCNTLLLPGGKAEQLAVLYDETAPAHIRAGDKSNKTVDLPVGSYAGGIVPLTPGLRIHDRNIGFAAPSRDTLTIPAGTIWRASYLVLKRSNFHYTKARKDFGTDDLAERALTEMGFRGETPYKLVLDRGTLDTLAYEAECSAQDGGLGGKVENPSSTKLLSSIPLRIRGLAPRITCALWREGAKHLDYFAVHEGEGFVMLNADKTAAFFAGNVAHCDPRLFVTVVIWDAETAWFRLHNPTGEEIRCDFATQSAFRGRKQLSKAVIVPAGASIEVRG